MTLHDPQRPEDPLRVARIRASYLFASLIALQVIVGVITRSPIDVAVLGLLIGALIPLLGIEAIDMASRAMRRPQPPINRKDDPTDGQGGPS